MAEALQVTGLTKRERYESLLPQLEALTSQEPDFMANVSNIVAALKMTFDFAWVGIYRVRGDDLVLGPFQGPVACTRIPRGQGVCGTAWARAKPVLVPDVNQFPGHIACSASSQSEIVVPALDAQGKVFLVLDVDSDQLGAFDEADQHGLEAVCGLIAMRYAQAGLGALS